MPLGPGPLAFPLFPLQEQPEGKGGSAVCAHRTILWRSGVKGKSVNQVTAPSISWLPSFRWKLGCLAGRRMLRYYDGDIAPSL